MIKRLLAAAAAAVLTVTAVLPATAKTPIDVPDESKNIESASMLVSLGIMDLNDDGSFRGGEFLTRAETARIAATVRDISISAYEGAKTGYDDVDADHEYAPYITACREFGLMNGSAENIFEPDGKVTAQQFNAVVVRLMGYEEMAGRMGGYPTGYDQLSVKLKIRKHLHQAGEALTRAEAAEYLYEALNTPCAEVVGAADGSLTYTMDGSKTLSELYMGLRRIEGTVNANGISALPGKNEVVSGKVMVGSVIMNDGGSDIWKQLGKYVKVYAELDADEKPVRVRTYVANSDYNNEVVVRAKDILKNETTSSKITVEYDNYKKTYPLASDCIVIKNGEVLTSYSGDIFKIKLGRLHIVEGKNQGGYGLVIIDEPQSLIFRAYSESLSTMYFYYGGANLKFPTDAQIQVSVDGEEATFTDLSEWMNIFIYKPANKNIYRIEGCSRALKGIYTNNVRGNDKIGVDNVLYNTSADFADFSIWYDALEIGTQYTFIMNEFDEIVAIVDSIPDSEKYGFVYSMEIESKFGEEGYIRLFTEDDERKSFKLSKKVIVEQGPTVSNPKGVDVLTDSQYGVVDSNGKVIYQLVKYSLNAKGDLNKICIAYDNTSSGVCHDDYFTLDYKQGNTSNIYYYQSHFQGIFRADPEELKVFNVPAEIVDGEPVVTSISDMYVENDEMIRQVYLTNTWLYDADESRKVGAVVRFVENGGDFSSDFMGKFETAIVNEVQRVVLKNGEIGYALEYYINGALQTIELEDINVTDTCTATQWEHLQGTPISDLKRGDVVLIYDRAGKSQHVYLIGRATAMDGERERISSSTLTTGTRVGSTRVQTIPGTVLSTDTEHIRVSTIAGNGDVCERSMTRNNAIKYYVYNSASDTLKVAEATDVSLGDKVFIRNNGYQCRTVLIIR